MKKRLKCYPWHTSSVVAVVTNRVETDVGETIWEVEAVVADRDLHSSIALSEGALDLLSQFEDTRHCCGSSVLLENAGEITLLYKLLKSNNRLHYCEKWDKQWTRLSEILKYISKITDNQEKKNKQTN